MMTPCRLKRAEEKLCVKAPLKEIKGARFDDGSYGDGFEWGSILKLTFAELINDSNDNIITRKSKMTIKQVDEVLDAVDNAIDRFSVKSNKLILEYENAEVASKKALSSVKDSANKLADALQKVESKADFNKLEKIVTLLERASYAMSTIAQLEEEGKLGKIIEALK